MACLCGLCADDRVAGEPGQVLATVLDDSLDAARRLEAESHHMAAWASVVDSVQHREQLRHWSRINQVAAERIRSLVSELCLLSQGVY